MVLRPQHAFGILQAADKAKSIGKSEMTIIEFGVANGGGLMNMIEIANKVTKTTGIRINVFGFDTGIGMPEPVDFRDHPEYYNTGDYPMNKTLLEEKIKGKATLIYGPIKETIKTFKETLTKNSPIGFISLDVDYYSSTKEVFELFTSKASFFLPLTYIYFDDIYMPHHNTKCGELLAIKEFNEENQYRNISYHSFFENDRLFKNAKWVKQIYYFHILDHDLRFNARKNKKTHIIDNPYF